MRNREKRLGRSLALPGLRWICVIAFSLLAFPLTAYAHKLTIFATYSDNEISGVVYFPTGPAPGLTVRLVDGDGKTDAETASDANGKFRFTGPRKPPFTLVSETADGHRAVFVVNAPAVEAEPHTHTPLAVENGSNESMTDAAIRAVVREELQPLREQLAEQAGRSRARDIFGGIGYIVGVFGLIVLLSRKSGKSS